MPTKTIFFGSGPVAARCLEKLLTHSDIEVVITKPRAAHHHGPMPVIDIAKRHKLPVLTVVDKYSLDELFSVNKFNSQYAILIDFGIIVSQKIIDAFPLGIINSHFSLLPKLRGADPITWSIANGDSKTGVSLMLVDIGMDTGKLITQKSLTITANDTSSTLTTRLIELSDQLIQDYLPRYLSGEIKPHLQPHPDRATYSRKLTKADGIIDWSISAIQIERNIRAFNEWPQSHTKLAGLDVVITEANVIEMSDTVPGKIILEKSRLLMGTSENWLEIIQIKPAGKKEMPISAFLAGYRHKLES